MMILTLILILTMKDVVSDCLLPDWTAHHYHRTCRVPLYPEAENSTPQRSSQLTDADSLSDLPNPSELLPTRSRL